MVTLFLSRAATYGYDQRCEMFGTQGLVSVGNVAEHATVLSTQAGIQHAKWQHSFPQRFQVCAGAPRGSSLLVCVCVCV
jgi:myo-inositol 2-dehydrogenase/D-chiro-inositol 1-dehydrogenase